jgi:hypothetical protein
MRSLRIFLFGCAVACSGILALQADSTSGPLQINSSSGWTVNYREQSETPFYTLSPPSGGNVLLVFWRSPLKGGKSQIPGLLNRLSKGFLRLSAAQVQGQPLNGDFQGDEFGGSFTEFHMDDGLVQTILLFCDGDVIWQGHFTGNDEMLKEAVEILKALKEKA